MSTGNTANSIVAFWARGLCMRITSRHQCQYKGDGEVGVVYTCIFRRIHTMINHGTKI
ncbi:hypothetical protein BofuT4_P067770.1 [Botrytis cinerea T4]|uniref:Uncharacterized protein n=1 Tax=Botryotinia fuckeliana (strain T4) TaxID=999810 RepID=G2XRK1_BOTF4|nr:hypothetical protein BofuT4_P067770.1 [Botrytis cinerea T4]